MAPTSSVNFLSGPVLRDTARLSLLGSYLPAVKAAGGSSPPHQREPMLRPHRMQWLLIFLLFLRRAGHGRDAIPAADAGAQSVTACQRQQQYQRGQAGMRHDSAQFLNTANLLCPRQESGTRPQGRHALEYGPMTIEEYDTPQNCDSRVLPAEISDHDSLQLLGTLACHYALTMLLTLLGYGASKRPRNDEDHDNLHAAIRCRAVGSTTPTAACTHQVPQQHRRAYHETRRSRRIGDGNCFWRSIAAKRWRWAKKQVQQQAHHHLPAFNAQERCLIETALAKDAWVNEPTIRLAASCLGLDIHICMEQRASRKWINTLRIFDPQCKTQRKVVLAYTGTHYDCLRASQGNGRARGTSRRTSTCPEGPTKDRKEPEGQSKQYPPTHCRGRNKRKEQDELREERQDGHTEQEKPWAKIKEPSGHPKTRLTLALGLLLLAVGCAGWYMTDDWMDDNDDRWDRSLAPRVNRPAICDANSHGIRHHLARPVYTKDITLPSATLQGGGTKTPAGKAAARMPRSRPRTRRIQVTCDDLMVTAYVPDTQTSEEIEMAAALHFGLDPQWTERIWHDPHTLSIRNRLQTTKLSAADKEHLADLLMPFKLGHSFRALHTSRELYLGLRSTRQPGLSVASATYQEELRSLNAHLKRRLPQGTWHAIGILEHGAIKEHVDQAVRPLSYALSLARGLHTLRFQSPLTGSWTTQPLTRKILAFNPLLPHAVEGEGRGLALTLYSPRRQPSEEQLLRLGLLGFPTERPRTPNTTPPVRAARPILIHTTNLAMPTRRPTDQPSPRYNSGDFSDDESRLRIRSTTTSGNGYAQATPEWQSDDQECSRSLAATILEDSPVSEPLQSLPWASLEHHLDGGGNESQGQDDEIARAVQVARAITQMYSKKQMRIICKMEARTTRRILQTGPTESDKQRTAQLIEAAGRRLTLAPQANTRTKAKDTNAGHVTATLHQGKGKKGGSEQPTTVPDSNKDKGKGKSTSSKTQPNSRLNKPTNQRPQTSRSFTLLPEEWQLPIREPVPEPPHVSLTQDGLYMVENAEMAKAVAHAAARVGHKIGLVTPGPISDLRLAPHQVNATLISELQVDKGGQRSRQTTRCRAPVHVYNISAVEAFTGEIHKPIKISSDGAVTTVLRIHCDITNLPTTALENDLAGTVKTALAKHAVEGSLLDAWGWKRTQPGEAMGLVRTHIEHLIPLLKQSGQHGLWIETPLSQKHVYAPIWVGGPQETVTSSAALEQAGKLKNSVGLIRKLQDNGSASYAIRVPQGEIDACKETLKMDTRSKFRLQGLPAAAGLGQAKEVVKELGWQAEVLGERGWFRGRPSWTIVAQKGPPCNEAQITPGYERCWIAIRPARRPIAPTERIPPEEQDAGPSTWAQATRGYRAKTQPSTAVSGKGKGFQDAFPPLRPQSAPASGDDDRNPKRQRKTPPANPPWSAPTTVAAGPSDRLQAQVEQLERAMHRMEEMFKKLAESIPQQTSQSSQSQPLAGGGEPHARPRDDKEPGRDRERSPRRETDMSS